MRTTLSALAILALLGASYAWAQPDSLPEQESIPVCTVYSLTRGCVPQDVNFRAYVRDAASASDCTTGGGTTLNGCRFNGLSWVNDSDMDGGGGGASTGCPAGDTSCVEVATTPDICAGLQTAFNELLDPNQVGGIPAEVTVVAPAPGTYDCDQRVRFCLSTGTTPGASAPACDDTSTAYPRLRGVGDWSSVEIVGNWTVGLGTNVHTPGYWQPSASGPDAMIWIGDLYATENLARLVSVDWPGLWVETGGSGNLSVEWNRNAPLLCDGCTGRIGYKSRSAGYGVFLQGHGFGVFVGRSLDVALDIETPPWAVESVSVAPQVIGDGITVSGRDFRASSDAASAFHFGRASTASGALFYDTDGHVYGDTDAIQFHGTYSTTPDFVAGNGIGARTFASLHLRGEVGRRGASGGTNKPWVDISDPRAGQPPRITVDALVHQEASNLNASIRYAGTTATTFAEEAASRPRFVLGSAFFDMYNLGAANHGHGPIHCHTARAGIPCEIELTLGAARTKRHQWVQPFYYGGNGRTWPQFRGQRVIHPQETTRVVTVSGTTVSGECVKGLNGGAASIGACASGDEVVVTEPTVINYQRLDLLEARPASSQCLVAVEQTVHPGVATWVHGPTAPVDCTAADTPHTGCTGSGAGASLRNYGFAWAKLEYGRAATASMYQKRTTEPYDFDEVAGSSVLYPGQAWRVVVKDFKTCSGGSAGLVDTLDWQCSINSDCLSPTGSAGSRTCNTVGTCGDLGLSRITVSTFPALPEPQCFNGIDDDADGLVDYPQDTGCSNYDDAAE